jgi:hypothetical protein
MSRPQTHAEKLNVDYLIQSAMQLAPMFRNKFDYSDPKDFDKLASLAFEQAIAIRKRGVELYDEAAAKDAAEAAAAKAKKEVSA